MYIYIVSKNKKISKLLAHLPVQVVDNVGISSDEDEVDKKQ